jgi:hypothetical protein
MGDSEEREKEGGWGGGKGWEEGRDGEGIVKLAAPRQEIPKQNIKTKNNNRVRK